MNILTIIPARGGSKGVPGKNSKMVYGKPLITWTIECAAAVPALDCIIVSSDDDAILDIARRNKRATARKRPASLARDETPISDVIRHVLATEEEASGTRFDAILLLQPTSPMREPQHLMEAIDKLTVGVNSVISVCEMRDTHPARMYAMPEDELLVPLNPEFETARRQDIPPAFYRSGSIYLVRRVAFEADGSVMAKPARGYLVDQRYLLNIDEPRDMIIAETLIAAWQTGSL